ncbi:MAG: DUF692 domain-containing protein [Xenococcaceae cyanobacterium MO_188.B19]|nr:DUF692 domain-containing protein [Xenococcaceae cyanobacterium MO_188.B19]
MNIEQQLGIGIGYREQFKSELFLNKETVDFLEIIGDRYLDSNQYFQEELELLTANFPLIPHFINLSLGSAEGIDTDYLKKLAKLINKINPPWWSEHLCFSKAGGIDIGHLSPLPHTKEAIDIICRNIKQVQSYIDTPLILENITYMVEIPGGEMTEAQFIGEIAEKTNCGLLLDITNLYINSTNHGYDIDQFLSQLPLERVVQLHFVGGYSHDGILIDSHSEATPLEVWQLMEKVVSITNINGVILERDENIPPFTELLKELDRARSILVSS